MTAFTGAWRSSRERSVMASRPAFGVALIGVTPMTTEVAVPVMSLVFEERVLTGSVYGSSRPRVDIPRLIELYRGGRLKLDELLTRTYPFADINAAYAALERGEVARSVVVF